jgi:NADH-quinone oxidoreductase subunit L
VKLVWLIPLLPVIAFVVLVFFGRRLGGTRSGILATAAMAGSFVVSVLVWAGLRSMHGEERHYVQTLYTWLPAGGFHVDLAFLVDPLSVTMCLFVTFVGSLIFLYSIGYIHGDADAPKFFLYLSFFALSMLILVLGSSLLVTFLGWEGVGAASYFLIGFWFQDIKNSSAGKKAFITNRVGDWGFMTAMFFAFFAFGTLNYSEIFAHVGGPAKSTLTAITVLVLIGACGKSAQLPLYLWLPDAMAGPTPVPALMHAATMVTAGVYLLVRMNPVIAAADPWASTLIAWVGAITALFAATVAISQRDIKKVLAYSTISQLGYMVMAVGSGAFVAAIFHMITHAFFKALLFLGAGSVIHGMNNEQDMTWYGKLAKYMPWTCGTFIVAWLAIAGIPPFSGFWSKGEILGFAWHKSPALWGIGVFTALLTAYYMSREVFLTFFGEQRWTELEGAGAHGGAEAVHAHGEVEEPHASVDEEGNPLPVGPGAPHYIAHGAPVHPHESPLTMRVPLVVLAVGAFGLGILNLPFGNSWHVLDHWLDPSVVLGESTWQISAGLEWALEIASVALAVIGIALAAAVYLRMKRERQLQYEPEILDKAWYYDIAVSNFMDKPGRWIYNFFAYGVDHGVIDGAVNGVGRIVRFTGSKVRRVQTGYVRNYALAMALGVVLLVGYTIVRGNF